MPIHLLTYLFSPIVFYLVMGFFGAWGATYIGNQDILDVLINLKVRRRMLSNRVPYLIKISPKQKQKFSPQLDNAPLQTALRVSVYLFPTITLLSSIPIYSIVIRYNLLENKQCSVGWFHFFSFPFPFSFLLVFYVRYSPIFTQGELVGSYFPMVILHSFLYWRRVGQCYQLDWSFHPRLSLFDLFIYNCLFLISPFRHNQFLNSYFVVLEGNKNAISRSP